MAEDTNQEKQDGQKTLVSFIVGLLIGGMLVWAFSGPTADAPDNSADEADADTELSGDDMDTSGTDSDNDTDPDSTTPTETPRLQVGNGSVSVNDQPAGSTVALDSATYPVSEGWIGIRTYNDGELGRYINGVVRFSESQGLIPEEIILQNPTVAGQEYAVVIFAEDGDFDFSTAGDVQIDEVFDTFTAQ